MSEKTALISFIRASKSQASMAAHKLVTADRKSPGSKACGQFLIENPDILDAILETNPACAAGLAEHFLPKEISHSTARPIDTLDANKRYELAKKLLLANPEAAEHLAGEFTGSQMLENDHQVLNILLKEPMALRAIVDALKSIERTDVVESGDFLDQLTSKHADSYDNRGQEHQIMPKFHERLIELSPHAAAMRCSRAALEENTTDPTGAIWKESSALVNSFVKAPTAQDKASNVLKKFIQDGNPSTKAGDVSESQTRGQDKTPD